jgi:outer membrane lipoprotein SlyB
MPCKPRHHIVSQTQDYFTLRYTSCDRQTPKWSAKAITAALEDQRLIPIANVFTSNPLTKATMSNINTNTPGTVAQSASTSTVLWIAVGLLGAATLAMGAMLLRGNTAAGPVSSEPVPLAAQTTPATDVPPAAKLESVDAGATARATAVPKPATPKPQARPLEKAQKSQKTDEVVAQSPAANVPAVQRIPPAPVCAVCGTVESVNTAQREPASGSGVGVIAGAAIGGLLGNQVGGGTGKDLATIAGMVGGGWAGNTVEKKMKRETVYEVAVRMEDGSLRKLEQKSPVSVGTKVTLNGGNLSAVPAAQ